MIAKCTKQDFDILISYIGNDYPKCLYLFLNLNKYGVDSLFIDVYAQKNEGDIKAILLKYYSCVHVFSRWNDFNCNELIDFLGSLNFSMIYCRAETAMMIHNLLPWKMKGKSVVERGWVAELKQIDKPPQGLANAVMANDFEQIAKLIYADEDISLSYKYSELVKQLKERNQEGFSRNLVIKENDTIVAHACTNAEFENLAVVGELVVRKEYRRHGYASEIWRQLCWQLLKEGKRVFSFYYSDASRNLHKKVGFIEVCGWMKIVFPVIYEPIHLE